MMPRDTERLDRITSALQDAGLDALVCTLPENVLLLTGYWPVVGTAVAVATADGHCAILAPEDESDLAHTGWAHEVRTYAPGSLESLVGPAEAVRGPLESLLGDLQVARRRSRLRRRSQLSRRVLRCHVSDRSRYP